MHFDCYIVSSGFNNNLLRIRNAAMAAAVDNSARDFECIRFDHASGKVTANRPRAVDVLDCTDRIGSRVETKILAVAKPGVWRWNNNPLLAEVSSALAKIRKVKNCGAHACLKGDTGRP
jgi:hypothetical protein